jgi:hypothetical protein
MTREGYRKIIMVPRCRQVESGSFVAEKEQSLPSLACVEPAHIPIQGVPPPECFLVSGQAHKSLHNYHRSQVALMLGLPIIVHM